MILIKLTRDETRAVQQYFFPYLDHYCQTKEREALNTEEKIMQLVIIDQYDQLKIIFTKKLLLIGKNISIKMTFSHATILYKLLMALPLEQKEVWLWTLRQHICNIIYPAMMHHFVKMKQPVETG